MNDESARTATTDVQPKRGGRRRRGEVTRAVPEVRVGSAALAAKAVVGILPRGDRPHR
jgi:hypothetical protein